MKTVVSEAEVTRIPTDAVGLSLQKLPYDAQDPQDRALAEHFLLKNMAHHVNPRLDKIEKKLKEEFKGGEGGNSVTLTKNYRREISYGLPRMLFNLDAFIEEITKAYPDVMAHRLREIAVGCKRPSAPPTSIEIEYIGDVVRDKS